MKKLTITKVVISLVISVVVLIAAGLLINFLKNSIQIEAIYLDINEVVLR